MDTPTYYRAADGDVLCAACAQRLQQTTRPIDPMWNDELECDRRASEEKHC